MKIKHALGAMAEAVAGMSIFYMAAYFATGMSLSLLQVLGTWAFALLIHCSLMFVMGMLWVFLGGSRSGLLQKPVLLSGLTFVSSSLSAFCISGFLFVALVAGIVFGTCSLLVNLTMGPIDTRYSQDAV